MPNFISIEQKPRPRHEGIDINSPQVRVADLSDPEAEEYGELMKQAFIQHHKLEVSKTGKSQNNG